ncbi:Decaprenyl diphosphate synthase-like protein [Lyophyllum atratum]|nr:Decaprenyl diphosphate synthase-like protein [Lyophyllum atratum]
MLTSKMSLISRLLCRVGLMIGFELLPQRVRDQGQYQLKVLSTPWQRAIQKILMAVLWFFYPMLMWLPLRGAMCLILISEPQLRPVFMSSLQTIHSMNIHSDEPFFSKPAGYKSNSIDIEDELPSYVLWLDSGKEGRSFLGRLVVRVLRAQLLSSARARWSVAWVAPWVRLSAELVGLTADIIWRRILDTGARWKTQIKESAIFGDDEIKLPRHIGFVMDGNRRYARTMGQSVRVGHQRGALTAVNVLQWWLRFMPNTATYTHPGPGPQYLTLWVFSTENFKRPKEEVDVLFRLMTVHFNSLAFTSSIHLFQIRVRIVGNRERLPRELVDAIELLEDMTRRYSRLFLQIAVGYGGRDEIVHSVRSVIARGVEVTEGSISQGTFCSQMGVPPVELIVRTSERRTSGFFLWDTQTAELHFLDKLWPQLTEGDWLDAIASFSQREMRNGR